MKTKVISVSSDLLTFENGCSLYSDHSRDCCESHYIDFSDLKLEDFQGLEFDLSGDFFNRIEGYGIELLPISGHSVRVPGYGYNNGYYSSNLDLILECKEGENRNFDISECQLIDG